MRKEAVLSSQIEGTQRSLRDVLSAEAKVPVTTARLRDINEVLNYIEAMNHGLDRLTRLPVSARLIREIHEKRLHGVRGSHRTPGELRISQNWIGPGGCALNEATFVPPPPDGVPAALGNLALFLNHPGELPTLIWIGLAHAQFETIHPLLDGNGRIGRLLITFLLYQQRILLKPVLYLSDFFKQHQAQYYEELQAVRDTGDWERWLAFFLRGVAEVSKQATETVRRILTLRETHHRLITDRLGYAAGDGHRVLEYLYESPIVSVNGMQNLIAKSDPSANNLVTRMAARGILHEFTGQSRNRRFIHQDYINIFHDTESEA